MLLPVDWGELAPLLDMVLDAPPEQRGTMMLELSGGDPRRLAALQHLVAECDRETPFLDRPAGERFASLLDDEPEVSLPAMLGGRYRIEHEIGRGGMARVYLAHDEKHARSVAIKVIRAELAASLGRERFLREINIAARLRHPNIVPLFDSGDSDGVLHFVMPYEEGPSLRARLGGSVPLSVIERIHILRDIARALAYAHAHGVVHRDVKPDNVMLSGGAAVVTDFGIAKAVSVAQGATSPNTLTQSGAGIGTPAYMAPEQAVGDPSTDHRADIYAFGCLAYELFAGRPPFHGMPAHQIIAAHVGAVPVPIQDVSAEVPASVAALIAQCLQKKPAARPQSAVELLAQLDSEPARSAASIGLAVPPPFSEPAIAGSGDRVYSALDSVPVVGAPVDSSRSPPRARRSLLWFAIPVAAVLCTVLVLAAVRKDGTPVQALARALRVLPMQNETGDRSLDYIATGIADGVARRLASSGGLQVRSGAQSEWPSSVKHDYATDAGDFGGTILLRMVLARVDDSLEVRASVLDAGTSREKALAARRFATSQLREVESALAAQVSGAVFRVARPTEPRAPDSSIDPESYRLMLEGWHQMFTLRNVDSAKKLFSQATEKDRTNARAWAGLSSTWGNQTITNRVPFELGYDRTSAAASQALLLDSLQGSALANLAFVKAWKYRNVAVGEDLLRRAKAAEPSNPEIYQVASALYRHAWQWEKAEDAIRVAQQLDPLRSAFIGHEADLLACQDRVAEAERLLQRENAVNPSGIARTKLPIILARLGRFDEAIDVMRKDASMVNDRSAAAALASARGRQGYWSIVQQRGRGRRARLLERNWVSPFQLMLAHFEAGDTASAYAMLDGLERERDMNLVKLRCAPEIDAERGQPRLDSVLARIPGFALR